MNKLGLQIFGSAIGFSLLGTAVGVEAVQSSGKSFLVSRASNDKVIILNSSNSPTLSNGSGTLVDEKGVTWEYFNASDYASGHVTLNNQSYVGVSSSSAYGITAISGITANFSGDELWLLNSVDGITWNEDKILTSGEEVISSNNWRYVRFYNYSSSVNIDSISITYECSGISSTEDVDGARYENVIATSNNLTYERETSELSPNSVDGEAVRFTKTGTAKSDITIGFGKTFTVGETQNKKIEFDMKTSNINYGKTLSLRLNGSQVGSSVDSSKHSSYKSSNIANDWYHIEVPITCLISTISGYNNTDLPDKNVQTKQFNGIYINAGSCIIDNLRLTSNECELGIFNNGTSFSSGGVYWFKVSWVGKLHSCVMSFDNPIAEQVTSDDPKLKNGSPFYIRGLSSGSVTVTATLVVGYNRRVQTIQKTLTVN